MTASVTEKKYFNFCSDTITAIPDKNQDARNFLNQLYQSMQGDQLLRMSRHYTIHDIVDRVVTGYTGKQGIIKRIWECFLNMITFLLPCLNLYLSDTQQIHHYAEEIGKMNQDYKKIVYEDDPAADLKTWLIRKLPLRWKEILEGTERSCVDLALSECMNDNTILRHAADCALHIKDKESAKKALSLINDTCSDYFANYCRVLMACILENDVEGAKEILIAINKHFHSFDEAALDTLAQKCFEEKKASTLITALAVLTKLSTESAFYLAVCKQCIKHKDRESLAKISDKLSPGIDKKASDRLGEAVDMLLEESKRDRTAYQNAYQIAKKHRTSLMGFGSLMKIFNQLMTASIEQELALSILEDVRFFDPHTTPAEKKQYQDKIIQAFNQLIRASVQKEQYALAEKTFYAMPSYDYFFHESPTKELIQEMYDHAMKKKQYSLAIAAAGKPLILMKDPPDHVIQEYQLALKRLQVLDPLLPQTGDDRDYLTRRIKWANELINK